MSPTPKPPEDTAREAHVLVASQWRLIWWRFRKHRLAVVAGCVVLLLALVALFGDFVATGSPLASNSKREHLPPQSIHWFDNGRFRPHVYGIIFKGRDPETFGLIYEADTTEKIPLKLFAKGEEYKFLGFIPMTRRLIGIQGHPTRTHIYLLGTDGSGRDLWSRLMYGTRISMSIGLVGVMVSLVLGVTLGGISGYYGGWVDTVIQRVIEFLRSIPTIPLWLALAAALPPGWSILKIYLAVTIIISLIAWTGMARVVRGKFLALREEDFVMSARLAGCSEMRIIFRHMVPAMTSHIIAATTLAIPGMIISETALSFLGLGLRPPAISWGVLLKDAQKVQVVALYPWLMTPALAVILAVLAFNFFGDGLRDAADPYGG
jgi:peptide/nickel transport system permease protein